MADGDSVLDIEALVRANDDFRREVRTTEHSQIVLMTIPPEGEIGDEVHDGIDQTLVFEEGEAEAVIAGESFPVRAGQVVSKGQVIGYEGSTGHSTGAHLHWMVEYNGSFVNPRLFT